MTSKREKLQYAYVFLTDFVTTGISVVLAWLITDNVFNKLQDYATFDWIQALCLLLLAFVLTFLCFDQDQNIVTRSKGDEIILALKFNVVLGVVNAACLLLAKATLLDANPHFTQRQLVGKLCVFLATQPLRPLRLSDDDQMIIFPSR